MLQAHSFFWHYLWVAPNVLLLLLAFLLWRRGLHRQYPALFAFTILSACAELAVYVADVAPSVSANTFWGVDLASLLIEGPLKFVLIAEVFALVFGAYASLAELGKLLIRAVGVILVLTAALAAAYAQQDSLFAIVSGAHLAAQSIYFIESGLLVFIFLFSAYFNIKPSRPVLGIALGLAVSACIHLATWGIAANSGLPPSKRVTLDFLNMVAYHICVLIWFYYLLVPGKVAATSAVPLTENNLGVWNRELERLLHQ